jgi:uncharacterized protein YlxW (UPF0749 family)
MNETLAAVLWTTLGGIIVKAIESVLKRGENRTKEELERDKLDHEQALQMRSELRQEIERLYARVVAAETHNAELERKVIALEKDNALKDTQIAILQDKVSTLQTELDKFNRKVYYVRKEDDK